MASPCLKLTCNPGGTNSIRNSSSPTNSICKLWKKGLYLSNKEIFQKSFFILDGDKYVEESEKLKCIEKRYSGTECGAENNRKEILTRFFQYSSKIKDGKFISPEEFIYDVIIQSENEKMKNTETYDALKNVQGVNDSHQYFPVSYQVDFIIEDFSKYLNSEWLEYTKELKGILSSPIARVS